VRVTSNVLAGIAALCLLLSAGCSGDNASVKQRVAELEKENKDLKEKVEKLSGELRPLQGKVDQLDLGQQRMEKTLVDARNTLKAEVIDMVDQQVHGGRRRVAPQAAPQPRFEEKPYMGFDGQDIEPDVARRSGRPSEERRGRRRGGRGGQGVPGP
jgi:TolA-binding protein